MTGHRSAVRAESQEEALVGRIAIEGDFQESSTITVPAVGETCVDPRDRPLQALPLDCRPPMLATTPDSSESGNQRRWTAGQPPELDARKNRENARDLGQQLFHRLVGLRQSAKERISARGIVATRGTIRQERPNVPHAGQLRSLVGLRRRTPTVFLAGTGRLADRPYLRHS